ncbi:MAG: peptidoglycan DD-metalloendopeptidase family protein [Pseudomonadota bacterium]
MTFGTLTGAATACALFSLALGACTSARNYAPVEYASGARAGSGASVIDDGPRPIDIASRRQDTTYAPVESRSMADLATRTTIEEAPLRGLPSKPAPVRRARIDQVPLEPARAVPAVSRDLPDAFSPPVGYVRVEPGDTVYALSRKHGVSPGEIIAENNLRTPYALSVGQFIRIPGKIGGPSPAAETPRVATRRVPSKSAVHTVRSGDTLYSIATRNGLTVDEVARSNGLSAPYALSVGDQLRLPGADGKADIPNLRFVEAPRKPATARPAAVRSPPPAAKPAAATAASPGGAFDWPVRGPVLSQYGVQENGRRNDGINISAPAGTPVRAAASGVVIHRGDELEGYGKLILIKHADGWVTAYAHTDQIIVQKGDKVERGQIIAKVGASGGVARPQLHFELRKDLRPVDPQSVLGSA